MSEKLPRYQIRYQTRNNNSPEESLDDDDDDDNDSNPGNNLLNRQPNQPPNQPPLPLPNQNMNDRGDGDNNPPPDGGQNNIIAQILTALAQALGNLQSASAQAPREQNIAQILKFHGYGNENPTEWAKDLTLHV